LAITAWCHLEKVRAKFIGKHFSLSREGFWDFSEKPIHFPLSSDYQGRIKKTVFTITYDDIEVSA
jgi:hypothetical protein